MNLVYSFRIKQKSQSEAEIIRNKKQAMQKQKTQEIKECIDFSEKSKK